MPAARRICVKGFVGHHTRTNHQLRRTVRMRHDLEELDARPQRAPRQREAADELRGRELAVALPLAHHVGQVQDAAPPRQPRNQVDGPPLPVVAAAVAAAAAALVAVAAALVAAVAAPWSPPLPRVSLLPRGVSGGRVRTRIRCQSLDPHGGSSTRHKNLLSTHGKTPLL